MATDMFETHNFLTGIYEQLLDHNYKLLPLLLPLLLLVDSKVFLEKV